MQTLPANVYSVASVREIDRAAIEDHGIPGYTLMIRAGAAAVRAARRRFPDARRWQIICGAGNNGGDGYVVARLAANDGIGVSVLGLVDPASLSGDAAVAYEDFVAEGGVVMPWAGELDGEAELLVDAILGSGLERDVGGKFADAVSAINAHAAKVLALDIPTGIHGDSGNVLGAAVAADLTVTFVGLKTGLFLDSAANFCGELMYDGLDIPDACRAAVSPCFGASTTRCCNVCFRRDRVRRTKAISVMCWLLAEAMACQVQRDCAARRRCAPALAESVSQPHRHTRRS